MLIVSRDGKRGYTANVEPGTVSVLDMTARKTIAVIPISGMTQRIAMSRDGSMVFTADQTKPQIAVIDTAIAEYETQLPADTDEASPGALPQIERAQTSRREVSGRDARGIQSKSRRPW